MSFDMFKSCQNCPYRTITPNCHDERICAGWAYRQNRKRQIKVEKEKTRPADNYIKAKIMSNKAAYLKSLKKGQKHGR